LEIREAGLVKACGKREDSLWWQAWGRMPCGYWELHAQVSGKYYDKKEMPLGIKLAGL